MVFSLWSLPRIVDKNKIIQSLEDIKLTFIANILRDQHIPKYEFAFGLMQAKYLPVLLFTVIILLIICFSAVKNLFQIYITPRSSDIKTLTTNDLVISTTFVVPFILRLVWV